MRPTVELFVAELCLLTRDFWNHLPATASLVIALFEKDPCPDCEGFERRGHCINQLHCDDLITHICIPFLIEVKVDAVREEHNYWDFNLHWTYKVQSSIVCPKYCKDAD
jgi:hypothetical protein